MVRWCLEIVQVFYHYLSKEVSGRSPGLMYDKGPLWMTPRSIAAAGEPRLKLRRTGYRTC